MLQQQPPQQLLPFCAVHLPEPDHGPGDGLQRRLLLLVLQVPASIGNSPVGQVPQTVSHEQLMRKTVPCGVPLKAPVTGLVPGAPAAENTLNLSRLKQQHRNRAQALHGQEERTATLTPTSLTDGEGLNTACRIRMCKPSVLWCTDCRQDKLAVSLLLGMAEPQS